MEKSAQKKEYRILRPLRLVLVRHGESEANVVQQLVDEGESFGFPPEYAKVNDTDVPLTEKGREQARKAGAYLEKHFGSFDISFVSPFRRTQETFDGILAGHQNHFVATHLRKNMRYDSRLREKDFGAVNFLTKDEIQRFFPFEWSRKEREGKYLYRPLGGESWYDVKDLRVTGVLNTIYRDHPGKTVLIVSHSVVIRCFRMKLERFDEDDAIRNIDKGSALDSCGICVFEYDSESGPGSKLVLKEWNTIAK